MFSAYHRIRNRYRQRFGLDFEIFPRTAVPSSSGRTLSQERDEALDTLNGAMLHYDAHSCRAIGRTAVGGQCATLQPDR
jgi:hypothetical protein